MFYLYLPPFTDDANLIPAAYLNQIRVNVGNAIDSNAGGSYAPTTAIDILGAGMGSADVTTLWEVLLGGQTVDPVGATIADANNQTFALAAGQVRQFAANTGAHIHDMSTTGAVVGSWIHFIGNVGSAGTETINRTGFGGPPFIVQLPAAAYSSATLYFDGLGVWRLLRHVNATPGAHA